MSTSADRLRSLKTFDNLVRYLEEELDWPLREYDFEELTFEYLPAELGLREEDAVKVRRIHQLRPLEHGQPWGIFFVEFEKKKLPVVVLRRILSHLVVKKRAAASKAKAAAWDAADILFISAFGDEATDQREIAFAHFHQASDDLPTLRVLGWDGGDTPLKLDHVASTLKSKLHWPDDPADHAAWREQWSRAFRHRIGHVIRTSDALAEKLAELARGIRDAARTMIRHESERGQLRRLHRAFQTTLIHDLTEEDFADTYAQTITYGLLTAAISRTEMSEGRHGTALIAENVADIVPVTNPFLKEMLQTFLKLGGRKGGIDFDELGIQDVVELLRGDETDLPAILRDFGNRTRGEDPVIHFYEHFLSAYNKKLKVQRGVFYTPQPVVSYIVRSVHELLQTEFGLEDGLASTVTWGEMAERFRNPQSEFRIPEGVAPDSPFVQILDPATGTATFLVEVIDVIHRTLTDKWKKQGLKDAERYAAWNEYVPKHLLPRLHGYELMMAPYAIAHMKLPLKLKETGFTAWHKLGDNDRARIYLTNALEPPSDEKKQMEFAEWAPALAHEAAAVNEIKRHKRFTIVIGNPPYSNFGQLNKIPFILDLLEDYKRALDDKKINLDDDFIKFVCFSEFQINTTGVGIHGMITNNAYLDGLTHRRMRQRLQQSFSKLRVANMHGSSKKKERAPDGTPDENVFDITVGVAIGIFCRSPESKTVPVAYADYWGSRETKTKQLAGAGAPINWLALKPSPENYFFVPKDFSGDDEYRSGWSISDAFAVWQNGLKTDRDELFFDFERETLEGRMRRFYASKLEPQFREQYQITASSSYDIEARRLATRFAKANIRRCLYRPMDIRWLYYNPNLTSRPAEKVMKHMLGGPNLGMIATRQTQEKWGVLATSHLCGHKSCAAYDINSLFPLYLYEHSLSFDLDKKSIGTNESLNRRPNFKAGFLKALAEQLHLPQRGLYGLPADLTPEDIFHYAYAIFHSPGYRSRYAEFLKIDFPRLPLTDNLELFRALAKLGGELVGLHLTEFALKGEANAAAQWPRYPRLARFTGSDRNIEKFPAADKAWKDGRVAINASSGFEGVPEEVWKFHIGGYQVCHKWLKDRKGRTLTDEDILHYCKIGAALNETIRLMRRIDEVINEHGGWPGAFSSTAETTQENQLPFA
jgi:hypothetical protein